eukprot:s3375_g6.t2
MAAMLDSQATFKERMNQLGVEEALQQELQAKGFNTYGSLAFAVSTTPQQITDAVLDSWLAQVTDRTLTAFQMSCVRRLVVESHALALSDLQRKVETPADTSTVTRKLPVAERQSRQKEQEDKLEGIIFSPEVTPSHALVDLCVNMVEQGVLTWIKPEECTSRAHEIQSLKKDAKVAIDADGSIKVSSKAAAISCSVTSELDLRNAFQRRSLAMDQAKLCSFREIEKWVQHLFLSHERSQPPGFSSVTLQQIIECDKQMFIRASNSLVGNLQSEPGAKETPLDKEIQTLRTSPELMPYLMPMQSRSTGKPNPSANQPPKRPPDNGNAKGNPNKYRKGKGKGKGGHKGKSKTGGLDLPPGCVAKTPDGKPLCFAFNRGVCGFKGLPHIDPNSTNGIRLRKANILYSFVVNILRIAMRYGSIVSLENPHRSWFWAAVLVYIKQTGDTDLLKFWDSLTEVFFHNCCHGGQRRKGTRWKSSPGIFSALQATCQNDHEHLPYQVLSSDAGWPFDTSLEAAYPKLLTDRVAHLVQLALQHKGYSFVPPANPRINTLASQHRQHRQRQQLIPEYSTVTWLAPDTPLTEWQHHIPSSQKGKVQEGEDIHLEKDQILVGTWHTPEEFVEKALNATHPMDNTSVSLVTLEAIQFVVNNDPRLVEIERKKNVLKAKIRAKQLETQEQALHQSLARPVQSVVKDKKLLLWKQLLEELAYDDMEVVHFMTRGVPLVGAHDHPEVYPLKIKPAVLTEAELRDNAQYSRKALIARRPQTEEPGFAAHLVETAKEEKELKFLEGPFSSEEEVTDYFGHSNWRVIRRFVIQQGQKLRPIDDGLESQINAAYSSTIRLDLQDADYVIAMVLELSKWPGFEWCGKTLDLSKAYKQLPILPEHRDLAVVHFKDESGNPVFYVPNSLMFGSTAAVFAFNRVSRSLWFLINKYLRIPSAVYFDDFPMFAPLKSAPAADEVVSDFLDLLGWKHDRTGPKGKPFGFSFDVLGLTLDIGDIPRGGGLILKNKAGRIEKICQKVEEIKTKGSLSLAEAQEIHGLLNFATGYFAGRFLKYACFKIFSLVSKDGYKPPGLPQWCDDVLTLLEAAQPRKIPLSIDTRTVVVFTDGSWESGVAGIGACLYDESHGTRLVIQDRVADELLDLWKDLVGDHLICQVELYTMVLVRWEFQELLSNRRVLLFVDNNSARGGVVKGRSSSPTMDDLLKAFFSAETLKPSFWWVERVPSKSNPSDAPSRGQPVGLSNKGDGSPQELTASLASRSPESKVTVHMWDHMGMSKHCGPRIVKETDH